MPFILAILAAGSALYFFISRARNAADMASELMDVASDVRLAARRFGFKRKTNLHPVESVDDPRVAIVATASAFLELDTLPTAEQRHSFKLQIQSKLDVNADDAEELAVLGRWLAEQCQTPTAAITRIAKRLYKLQGTQAFEPLLTLINETMRASNTDLNDKHMSALDDIKRALHL